MKRIVGLFVAAGLGAGMAAAQDAPRPPKKFPYFTESDTDKDGYLSQAEWDASGRAPKRLLRVDTDKDGRVSRAELHEATIAARAAREGADAQPKP
ncbi:MAG: hypothetical protein V4537_03685 [Pseudomonadota bacterium]